MRNFIKPIRKLLLLAWTLFKAYRKLPVYTIELTETRSPYQFLNSVVSSLIEHIYTENFLCKFSMP